MNEIALEGIPNKAFCSENIYLEKDYILVNPDTPVLPELKNRLEQWGFKTIFAEGAPIFTEIMSGADAEGMLLKQDNTATESELEAAAFFEEICAFVKKTFEGFKEGNTLRLSTISEHVKDIIQMYKTHRSSLLNFTELDSENYDFSVKQSVKTAILSIAMGEILKLPAHKQIEIGVAALLHRLGSMQIPQSVFYSDKELTPEQKKSITLFPVLGFRALKAADFPLPIALAILEHRENVDGTGYPRGITGDKISLYGKIVSVASSYCAAVSKRPFRANLDGHSGMLDLIKEKGKKYDERILRILLLTLTVYPIGTYVLMTDGSIGVVSATNSATPKYPTLKMVFDHNMTYYVNTPILQTSEDDDVLIDRALTRIEVDDIRAKLPSN
ncbi:MAG: HD domain-containing protein [Spirochaetales bacterium]|nr:HD domain-containing protein [Spirochaetales bacterium]